MVFHIDVVHQSVAATSQCEHLQGWELCNKEATINNNKNPDGLLTYRQDELAQEQ